MGGVGPVACDGPSWGDLCLCSGRSVFCVLDLVSLKGNAVHSEFCGVYGFGMALGSPSFNVQGFVPILLKD